MNIRVDHSNLTEITQTNSKVEIKGNVAVTTQETTAKEVEKDTGVVRALQQTTVETAFRSEESQMEKIQQEAENMEAELFQQKMAVVSNTMSEEDCRKMDGDGFSVNGTEVETIVTEIDKIKMELAKAGVDISIFGEGLSGEQLEALAGNAALASQLETMLKQADLPATEENISDCEETIQQAADLTANKEETVKYMLEQELPPTVENLYKAQHSTSSGRVQKDPQRVEMDEQLRSQVEQVITKAGLPVNEETMSYSQWMLDNQIPLTEENLTYVMDLNHMQMPPEAGQLMGAVLEAMAEGQRPGDAVILEGYSNAYRAEEAAQVIEQATDAQVWSVVEKGIPLTIENLQAEQKNQEQKEGQTPSQNSQEIPAYGREDMDFLTAKRQLEETRLMMTIQANYALLKKGIAIETESLEQLVEQLKSLEEDYYKSLLSQNGVAATEENAAIFAETIGKTQELASAPAYILGNIHTDEDTVSTMHEAGMAKAAEMKRAGEAYETLQTAPRADLGDSIQKAFRNVDDILTDLGLEITEADRRAVRILAYNQMEITPESIAQIKGADQKVQNLFQNLSPAVVMEMIREGVNPLEMDVEQLNRKAEEIRHQQEGTEEEKFSKYLWKLEQHQEITPQERDSYIGIYRLLNQIDKTDGAVVGALVNQGADLTMKNLLTAVRTNRNPGINVSVDENFGEADEIQRQELSISQQIEAAYQTDCAKEAFAMVTPEGLQQTAAQGGLEKMTPEELLWQLREAPVEEELERSYYREQMQEFSSAREAEAQVLQLLSGHDMPVTAYNIMAAQQMIHNRNGIFKSLFDPKKMGEEIDFEEVKAEILEEFGEAVKTPEDMAEAQEKLADLAENAMKTMIQSENVESVDIRDMRILQQQIALGTRMAKEETYAIPVLVADELTNVQLKIVRGKEERGRVDILFDSPQLGKVAARFQVQQESMKGYVISDSKQTIEELNRQEERIRQQAGPDSEISWNLDLIHSSDLDLSRFASEDKGIAKSEQTEEAWQVQTKTLYGIAKSFLEEVKYIGRQMEGMA
ncbi:MAG: hypothetical protein HFH41_07405 [Lachnospiraceae bacterium]|nr:hypothetical protein [Lachnospiraceae bacterium]